MSAYRRDHVKRDPATGRYAVRSSFDDEDPAQENRAWTILGGNTPSGMPNIGTSRARTADVDEWDDLIVPPESEE